MTTFEVLLGNEPEHGTTAMKFAKGAYVISVRGRQPSGLRLLHDRQSHCTISLPFLANTILHSLKIGPKSSLSHHAAHPERLTTPLPRHYDDLITRLGRSGEIGIRTRLKIWRSQGHVGSSPTSGT